MLLGRLGRFLVNGVMRRRLPQPYVREKGHCWVAHLPRLYHLADATGAEGRSTLGLYEDDIPLRPAGALHDDLRGAGHGQYSHWHDRLMFSTSDNTDPNTNGRSYRYSLSPALFKHHVYGWSPGSRPATNHRLRDPDPEQIRRDVEYTFSAVECYANAIRALLPSLKGKRVLEVGPGINYGGVMYLAAYGMRPLVADPFLAPWQSQYHTAFYTALRDELARRDPRADVRPLNALLKAGGYPKGVIACHEAPLEELPVADDSVDVVFSNAVLEHVTDLDRAFAELYRITRPGGFNLHQVDFRDHRNFDRPLEYLLQNEPDFQEEFARGHGEEGNRRRPHEATACSRAAGFEVLAFEGNLSSSVEYLQDFLPRLRAASGSPYRDCAAEDLHVLSGFYRLRKPARG